LPFANANRLPSSPPQRSARAGDVVWDALRAACPDEANPGEPAWPMRCDRGVRRWERLPPPRAVIPRERSGSWCGGCERVGDGLRNDSRGPRYGARDPPACQIGRPLPPPAAAASRGPAYGRGPESHRPCLSRQYIAGQRLVQSAAPAGGGGRRDRGPVGACCRPKARCRGRVPGRSATPRRREPAAGRLKTAAAAPRYDAIWTGRRDGASALDGLPAGLGEGCDGETADFAKDREDGASKPDSGSSFKSSRAHAKWPRGGCGRS